MSPRQDVSVLVIGQPTVRLAVHSARAPLRLEGTGTGLGAPASLAVHLARAGIEVRLLGRAGDDVLGRSLREALEAAGVGVDTLHLSGADGPTNLRVAGEAPARYPGAGASLSSADLEEAALDGVDHLHVDAASLADESVRAACLEAWRRIETGGGTLSVDLNYTDAGDWARYEAQACLRAMLGARSLLFMVAEAAAGLFPSFWDDEALLEGGHDLGAGEVVLLGRDGALAGSDGEGRSNREPGEAEESPEEDRLMAEVLAARLAGAPLRDAVEQAFSGDSPERG